MFKIRIKEDEKVIVKSIVKDIDDFDNIVKGLKIKYKGKNG